MNENKKVKVAAVKEVAEKLKASKAVVVAEYAGLTVKEIQELRHHLHESGVELKVYKNRLFKIAANNAGHNLDKHLVGPNLYAFGMDDEISPAKILVEFSKNHPSLKLKGGIYEGKVIDDQGIAEIASLPSLHEALTMLATSLLAPVSQMGKGLFLLVDEGKLSGSATKHEVKSETHTETKTEEAQA